MNDAPRRPAGSGGRAGGERPSSTRPGSGARTPGRTRASRGDAASTRAAQRDGAPPRSVASNDVPDAAPDAGRSRARRTSRRDSSAGAARTGEAPVRRKPGPGGWWPLPERSLVPSVLGLPPLAAVGVAAGLTALGVTVDLLRIGTLGLVFTICYLTGCVLGVAWVRRDALFWPMVVPPLLMAVAVPVVVLLTGTTKAGAGLAERLLVIGAPLVNGFPMMAWTTGLTLAVGVVRMITQPIRRGPGAARGAARTSGSPRRS